MGVVRLEQANGTTPFNIGKATGLVVVTTDGTRNSGVYTVNPNSNPTTIKELAAVTLSKSGNDTIITVTDTGQHSYKLMVFLLGMIKL